MSDNRWVLFVDAFAAWLVARIADASTGRLAGWVLGDDQDRALRQAARAAVRRTADALYPDDEEARAALAMIVGEVFDRPVPEAPLSQAATVLEAVQEGVARQVAPLDDEMLTGTAKSSAATLGIPASVLAALLTRNLLQEIIERGAGGGPLAPLANQFGHDRTHRQGQQIIEMLGEALDLAGMRRGPGEAAREAAAVLTGLDDSCRGAGDYGAVVELLMARAARDGGHGDAEVREFREKIAVVGLDPRILIPHLPQHQEALRRWNMQGSGGTDDSGMLASFSRALSDELAEGLFGSISEDCRRLLSDALTGEHPPVAPVSAFLGRLAAQLPPLRSASREAVLVSSDARTHPVPDREDAGRHQHRHKMKLTSVAAQMSSLPAADPYMTGRESLVVAAVGAIKETMARQRRATTFLTGQPGVGTSAVAIEIARGLAPDFPGGVLYVDLRGLLPESRRDARTVVRIVSEALGLDMTAASEGDDRCLAAFGAQLAGRRVLLLLDNALDADHVAGLAPAAPECCVIVTSRDRIQGYADPGLITLVEPLDRDAAIQVLALSAAGRAFQAGHLDHLARLCADVPLALRILGARMASRPDLDLAYLAQILDAESTRLDYLRVGGRAVRAAIRLSYDTMDTAAQVVLRLLGAAPGGVVTGADLAHCRGEAADRQELLLNRIADLNLARQSVLWQSTGLLASFTLFDLVRLFAAEADAALSQDEIYQFRRLFVARLADQLGAIVDDAETAELSGELDPARFHAAEQVAEREGWLDTAAELAFSLYILYRTRKELDSVVAANEVRVRLHLARGQYDEAARTCLVNADDLRGMNSPEHGLASARTALRVARDYQLPLRAAEADCKVSLILGEMGSWAEALEAGERGITRLTELGRQALAIPAAINNCVFATEKSYNSEALKWGRHALELADRFGEPFQQASAAQHLGRAELHASNYGAAIALFRRTREIQEAAGHWRNAAIACDDAAHAAELDGDIEIAIGFLASECDFLERTEDLPDLLEALIDLSALHVRSESFEIARDTLSRARSAISRPFAQPPPLMQQEIVVRQAAVDIFLGLRSSSRADRHNDLISVAQEAGEHADDNHIRALRNLKSYHAHGRGEDLERLLRDISMSAWNKAHPTTPHFHDSKLSSTNLELT